MSRPRSIALAALITSAMLAGGASAARASTVFYFAPVPPSDLQPGQTHGENVSATLKLTGRRCPLGRRCFKHATVHDFSSVGWTYPNCPNVEGQVKYFQKLGRAKRARPHRFHASGTVEHGTDRIVIDGRFPRHGRTVKGWFKVVDPASGCASGKIYFTGHPEKEPGS